METDELCAIVNRYGGTKAFATGLKVSQRIVQYWLAKKRRIRPMVADRIRELDRDKAPAMTPLVLRLCQRCGRDKNSGFHLRECGSND